MASKQVYAILAMIMAVLLATTLAKVFVVGDEHGWTINFDYKLWAADKDFRVGDKLVFHYPVGVHNVFKVNGTAFQECIKPPPSEALISGNDTITLLTPGLKWYICGVESIVRSAAKSSLSQCNRSHRHLHHRLSEPNS